MKNHKSIFSLVQKNTMLTDKAIRANVDAVSHIVDENVQGAIVECGVWCGGSMAAMLYRLLDLKDETREAYLFDTFAGMPEPSELDSKIGGDPHATQKRFQESENKSKSRNKWCFCSISRVKQTITQTNYPEHLVHFVEGKVEDTLPVTDVKEIAILRLDTDFYESTKCELEYLYPRVATNGVVIIDDYGVWAGAKKATDEYLKEHNINVELQKIDTPRRFFLKP
jgi:hypothetical protein